MLRSLSHHVRPAIGIFQMRAASRSSGLSAEDHNEEQEHKSSERSYVGQRLEKCLNEVTLLGRVGSDPQMRGNETHPVTIFTMATHTNYKYNTGEFQQKTEWHRISVFRPFLRDNVFKYLSKGQRAMVKGKITYGQITDSAGATHTTTSIVADDVIFFNKAVSDNFKADAFEE